MPHLEKLPYLLVIAEIRENIIVAGFEEVITRIFGLRQ